MIFELLDNFDKYFTELKSKVDFNLNYTLSKNLLKIRMPLTEFYSKIKINYYMPHDIGFYVNKTLENLEEFKKINTEKDFKSFIKTINN